MGDRAVPGGADEARALRERLAAELTAAVVRAEKRLGRAVDRTEMARRLNVSPSSLYAYLNGTTLAGTVIFGELLDALGVTGREAGRLGTLRDAAETARRLRAAHGRGRPSEPSATDAAPGPRPPVVPRQLPASYPQFVGREAEMRRLDALLADAADDLAPPPAVVTTIEGTAGVGKTTLALQWAHRVGEHFPDGQLHVDLRGFGSAAPVEAAEALHGFLLALGVAPGAVPAREPVASALLRTLLTGRRLLLVLDNARSADQVRPLLPSGPGCLAIVTSRNRLDGLVVREGALRVTLDVLPRYAARTLLERLIGTDRLAREPRAADELVELCARLPLALSVAAARAAAAPTGSVNLLVTELRQAQARLDVLGQPDADVDLRTVFQGSYALLPPPAGRLFRLLGCHPGPEIDESACAALAGTADPPRPLLDALTGAHLLRQRAPGRYALHDLLRVYAGELAGSGPPAERLAGTERLLRHTLAAARLADRHLEPWRPPAPDPGPGGDAGTAATAGRAPEAKLPRIDGHAAAVAWFETELATLQAVIAQAAATEGLESYAWRLARACALHLRRSGRRFQRGLVHGLAREAAERAGDRAAWCTATRQLGDAVSRLDRPAEARELLYSALRACHDLGDSEGVREVRLSLVRAYASAGDHRRALAQARLALAMGGRSGDPCALADGLTAVAQQQERLGRPAEALENARGALELYERLGHLEGEAGILLGIGRCEHALGRYSEAVGTYERSLALDRALGDRYREAHALDHLADTHAAAGRHDESRALRTRALDVLDGLYHPDARPVRAKLETAQAADAPTLP
ncbi:tetratricopeptide repeat protein [Streptomyces sp. NPDC049040]|uniref:tetratricopeptide repeat protein n=1 Tax=Streptomyces sp. NPDC049040 TaxID=3365593 RepID=UPI003723A1A0